MRTVEEIRVWIDVQIKEIDDDPSEVIDSSDPEEVCYYKGKVEAFEEVLSFIWEGVK